MAKRKRLNEQSESELTVEPFSISIKKSDGELIREVQQTLRIDKYALDDELERHAELSYRVSDALALRTSQRDAAKQHWQNVEAAADKQLRLRASNRDERITEKEIAARVRMHPDVREAHEDYLKLSHAVNRLTALNDAFTQRSYVLKTLAQLYVANYWGDATGSASDHVKTADADRARREMAKSRRRG